MKHFKREFTGLLISLMFFTTSFSAKAQDVGNPKSGPRNTINAYIGLIDLNINYERKINQKLKSYNNVRLGLGHGALLMGGEGQYVNASLVHLIGLNNSHLEIDLGVKYMITNSLSDPSFSETYIPDIFLGYRFEKPSGGIIFRAGLSYSTFMNLGVGYRF